MTGYDWLQSILRECKVSLRTPELISLVRTVVFNKFQVGLFFRNLKQVQMENSFPQNRVYNVDESVLSTVPSQLPKVLSPMAKIASSEIGVM